MRNNKINIITVLAAAAFMAAQVVAASEAGFEPAPSGTGISETAMPETAASQTASPETVLSETAGTEASASETTVNETAAPETGEAEMTAPGSRPQETLPPGTESSGAEETERQAADRPQGTSETSDGTSASMENFPDSMIVTAQTETDTVLPQPEGDETEPELPETPPFFSRQQSGSMMITVTADEGVLPAGTVMTVSEKKDEQASSEEDKAIAQRADAIVSEFYDEDASASAQYIYDIVLTDQDGNEVEPDITRGNIYVSFTSDGIGDDSTDTEVFHLPDEIMKSDNVSEEDVCEYTDILDVVKDPDNENTVTAQTNGFSIYVLRLMAAGQGDTLSITKYWDDAGHESQRPGSVTMDVYEPGGSTIAKTVTLTADNAAGGSKWVCDTGLPAYDSGGNEIQYVIKERSPGSGYLTLYDSEEGFVITFADDARYASSVYGLYLFYEDADGSIYAYNGQDGRTTYGRGLVAPTDMVQTDLAGARIVLTEENWIAYDRSSFSSFISGSVARTPRQEIEEKTGNDYPWSRQNAPTGEEHVWHYSIGDGQGFYLVQRGDSWSGSYIHIRSIEAYGVKSAVTNKWNKTDITVNKTWDDAGAEGARPGSVNMEVYDTADMNTAVRSVTVTSGEGWTKTVTGLPKYYSDGNEISYAVKEQAADGYSTTYSSGDFNGLAIHFAEDTNVNAYIYYYDEQSGEWKEACSGYGSYSYSSSGDSSRLKNETVYVQSMDFYVLPYSGHIKIDSIYPVHLNTAPRTSRYSTSSVSVEEAGGADLLDKDITNGYGGYSPYYCWHYTYSGSKHPAAGAYTVTNSAVAVEIVKTWNDGGYESLRSEVSFKIYSDSALSSLAKTVTLTAQDASGGNVWKKTVAPLPKYDMSGREITYTVVEEASADYTASYSVGANTQGGLKIKFGDFSSVKGNSCVVYRIRGETELYFRYYSESALKAGSEITVPGTEVWLNTKSVYNIESITRADSLEVGSEYTSYKGFQPSNFTFAEYRNDDYPRCDNSSAYYRAHYVMTSSSSPEIGNASVTNTIVPKRFNVNKYNISGTEEIEGAVIAVYKASDVNADGSVRAGADAVDTWTSKKGEHHDFGPKLNAGASYVLVETAAPSGYAKVTNIPFSVSDSGMVICSLERDSSGVYMIKDEVQKNSLMISKKVSGSMGSKAKEFDFTVSFAAGLEKLTSVSWEKSDGTKGTDALSGGEYMFTLSHGQSITFKDIPYGTKCTVSETSYADEGYVTTVDGRTSHSRSIEKTIQGEDISLSFENKNEGVIPTSAHSGIKGLLVISVLICCGFMFVMFRKLNERSRRDRANEA